MAEVAELIFRADSSQIVKAEDDLNDLNRTGKETDAVINNVNKTVKKADDVFDKFDKTVIKTDRDLVAVTQTGEALDKAISKIPAASSTADTSLSALNRTGIQTESVFKRFTGSFRVQGNAAQNAAFQVQDFAVQVAGGTSAVRAFAQQAPQFLSIFGAGGAIVGGAVAIAAAIGGPFLMSLFEAESATDKLKETLKALNNIIDETENGTTVLTDSFAEMANRSSLLAQASLKEALLQTEEALKAANERAVELATSLSPSDLGGRFTELFAFVKIARNQLDAGTISMEEFNKRVNQLFVNVKEDPSKAFRDVRNELEQIAEQTRQIEERRSVLLGGTGGLQGKSATEEAEKLAEKQREIADRAQAEQLKRAEQARAQAVKEENERIAELERRTFQIQDSLRTETQIIQDAYNERLGIIRQAANDGLILKQEADQIEIGLEEKKQAELGRIREREVAQRKQTTQQTLGAFSTLFGNLSGLMSSESKKTFKIGQKAAIAGAIVDGISATLSSYDKGAEIGGPVLGGVFAALAAAATGAMIGQIKSAKPPGRAQGGQVRPGQSYMVGEFGPEMITMGRNGGVVSPRAANDSTKLEVINNVRVIGGDGNAQVSTSVNRVSDRKFVQDIVVDLMANQSSPARNALHKTSNVRPVGQS